MPIDFQSMSPQQREAYILALRQQEAPQAAPEMQMQDVGGGYAQDAAAIKQQRALAELLRGQANAPIETNRMAGRFVVPVSPWEGIAKMGASYFAGKAEREADDKEGKLVSSQQKALAELLKSGKTPEEIYDAAATDQRLSPEYNAQFLTQGFASRISKQKAEAEAEQDARKQAYQEKRDELRAVQQQARDDARYEQMSQRDQARFDQQQKMQMASFENQNAMLDRRLAATAANSGAADPYYTTANTDQGMIRFNARTGQPEYLTIDGKVLVNTKDDPATRGAVAGAQERAKEIGGAEGKVIGQQNSSVARAPENLGTLDRAEALLKDSTGSGVGALADAAAGFVGISTEGAQAAEALKVEAAKLTMQVPRMEGPQSDKDTQLYKEAAGNLADSSKPIATRQKALEQMRSINKRYESLNKKPAGAAAYVRTGTDEQGRKVGQKADGTVEVISGN